jgi:hypothetical protein
MVYVHIKPSSPSSSSYWPECIMFTSMSIIMAVTLTVAGFQSMSLGIFLMGIGCFALAAFMVWAYKSDYNDYVKKKGTPAFAKKPSVGTSLAELIKELDKKENKRRYKVHRSAQHIKKAAEEELVPVSVIEDDEELIS